MRSMDMLFQSEMEQRYRQPPSRPFDAIIARSGVSRLSGKVSSSSGPVFLPMASRTYMMRMEQ